MARELRERFDRTLRQLVSRLEKELDNPAPETPDARGRRQVLLGAVRRLLVVAQVGGDTADKAAAVKDELDDVDRAVARTEALMN